MTTEKRKHLAAWFLYCQRRLLSILAGTPVGSTIVAADMAAFFISCVAGRMMGRR